MRSTQRTCEKNCSEYRLQYELGFSALVRAGDKLANLHVDYEAVELWSIKFEGDRWEPPIRIAPVNWLRGSKPMRNPRQGEAKNIIYAPCNDCTTVNGPPRSLRSTVAWVIERHSSE